MSSDAQRDFDLSFEAFQRHKQESARKPKTKVCSKCKVDKPASAFTPRKNRPVGLYSCCKACKAKSRKQQYRYNRIHNPYRSWAIRTLGWARGRKKHKVLILSDDIVVLLEQANYHCVYCDKKLNFQASMKERYHGSPSIDRIDPTQGYVQGNIAICCYRCNQIKNDATSNELRNLADRIDQLLEKNHECDR